MVQDIVTFSPQYIVGQAPKTLDPTLPIMQQLFIRPFLSGRRPHRWHVVSVVYLKLLGDFGSIQEQSGAETVYWTKVSWRKRNRDVIIALGL